MKFGLVTFCGNNLGSVLQCYATQTFLKDRDVECVLLRRKEKMIGRICQSLSFKFDAFRKIAKSPAYYQNYKQTVSSLNNADRKDALSSASKSLIVQFVEKKINHRFLTWNQLKKQGKASEFNAFLSGSDQIWNGEWFITNPIFFLRFSPPEKRVAWAPSFGKANVGEYNKSIYKKFISEYQFLSVRERNGQRIIDELTGRHANVLADPTVLLSPEEWKRLKSEEFEKSDYIMMFFIDKPSDVALKQAQEIRCYTGKNVLFVGYRHNETDDFVDVGPLEFLAAIDNAAFVLTDSFHAVLFSAVFKTPFFAYDRSTVKQVDRIVDFLNEINCSKRLLKNTEACVPDMFQLDSACIDCALKAKQELAISYIEKVIDHYK